MFFSFSRDERAFLILPSGHEKNNFLPATGQKSCLNFLQDWKDKNEKGSLSNNNDTGYINVGKTSKEINNSLCNINLTLSAVFKKG